MSLEGMRDLLKGSLGRSLEGLREEDRLAAAWPVLDRPRRWRLGEVTLPWAAVQP